MELLFGYLVSPVRAVGGSGINPHSPVIRAGDEFVFRNPESEFYERGFMGPNGKGDTTPVRFFCS